MKKRLFGIKSKAEKAAEQEMNEEWISVQKQLSKFLENQTLPDLDSYKKIDVTTAVAGTFDRFNVQNCSYINGKTTVGYENSMGMDLPINTWSSGIVLHQIKPGVSVQAGTTVACIISNLETALEIIKKLTDEEAEEKAAKEKAKAEAEAKAAAEAKAKEEAIEAAKKKLADEKAAKLAETQAALSQLENDLAAKKAEVASLGLDAQGIVQKAKLNKEIKELEPQIETLKAEVEKLNK